MAKKKVVAKKSTNKKSPAKKIKSVKKPAGKTAKSSQKSKPVKAAVKKTAKKTAKSSTSKQMAKKPVKAGLKKAAGKKAASKKVAPKKTDAKKTSVKANAKKSAPKAPAAKVSGKVAAKKPAAVTIPKAKKLDLTHFVTPLDDRLMVQVSGTERMTPGGLYIPDTVADISGNLHGVVVAVGRGHMNKKGHVLEMDVQVGDSIVFAEYSGSKIKIQNEDLIILRESEVMGVVAK